MACWLLKTEPDVYSYADLEREIKTIWDGVANNAALKHMRTMAPGDQALIYHTGDERQAVGIAEVISASYQDPKTDNPRLLVVDIRATCALPSPVKLADIKADPLFSDSALVRQGRLSIVPLTDQQWQRLLVMAEVAA